ncbi:hypothetical protein [Curtobacterium sp. VKM Ac-1393]|uniref:hypothetical protein n=1 Tax=Curtobacterium sp. VKM Ac-1393 TaxID=2783814 RepID=UPI00188C9CBD|nr:hypothetical protein [Curtobacterium sp. VKM Ac-1393]MBF4605955.1 hypothetical protein [Curtobacterium sp. VKM Ac-1393]
MTDTAAQAEWRWALADEQARVLLAEPAPRRFSIALAAGALAGVVTAVLATALSFEPGSTGRWITAIIASVLGLVLLLADAAVAALYAVGTVSVFRDVVGARRYLDTEPVRPRS